MARTSELLKLHENQRKASDILQENLKNLIDQIKQLEKDEQGVDQTSVGEDKAQAKLDPGLLFHLESLREAHQKTFDRMLTDAFGPGHKQDLISETMFGLDQLEYDDLASQVTSELYRDALTKVDGSGDYLTQLAAETLYKKKEKLVKRLQAIKFEGGMSFMNVVARFKEWMNIIYELQALAVEFGIKLGNILLALLFMMSRSDGIVKQKLMAFRLFLTKIEEEGVLLKGIKAVLDKGDEQFREGRYEDIYTNWYGSEQRIDSLLREVAELILNSESLLSSEMLPEEPKLMIENLVGLKRKLVEMKEKLTVEGEGSEGWTIADEVDELKKQFTNGGDVEEFINEVKGAIAIDNLWEQLLMVK